MILRTMDRPRPVPLSLVVKKGLKIRFRFSWLIPHPRVGILYVKALLVLADMDCRFFPVFHRLRRIDENVQEGPV